MDDIVLRRIEAAAELRTAVVSAEGPESRVKGLTLIKGGHRHFVESRVSLASQPDPGSCPACFIKQ